MIIYGKQSETPNYVHFGKYMLDHLRQANQSDVCLEDGVTRETLTYKEATQYAVNLSVALTDLGVKRGDTVAIGSEAYVHFMPTVIAVTFTGAAYTPYELEIGRAVLKHKLVLAKPKYFITSASFWKAYKDVLKNCDSIEVIIATRISDIPDIKHTLTSLWTEDVDVDTFEPVEVEGKTDPVLILYSSGTTGMPKGVEITHYSCILTCLPDGFRPITSLQTAFMAGEGWFINLFIFMTYQFLVLGRKVVFTKDLSINTVLKMIRDCKTSYLVTQHTYIRSIATSDEPVEKYFDSVKMIYCRSSPLRENTINQFKERFPKVNKIVQAMGLTECGEPMSEIWVSKYKPGSVGIVAPHVQVKIVDPKTRAILGPNQQGEICIKGSMIMKRYLDIDRFNYMDEDGYYKTGDLGYFDDDQYFYIVDRLTDVFSRNGMKISPVELENILLQHPDVIDAGVIGKPDPEEMAVPMAFVEKKPGSNVTEKELIEFVTAEVSPHMQLDGGVRFLSKLPRNPRGKILRRNLREMIQESK